MTFQPFKREQLYLSTITSGADALARTYGVGIELAKYCTAYNMDQYFPETDALVQQELRGNPQRILHGPFNELFPCAIDPEARALAARRYRQALALAMQYGVEKVVIHSGYAPWLYYDCWFEEQSILFWRNFLEDIPGGLTICLENVLETRPEPLLHIVDAVQDDRLRICLDIGHANAYSQVPVADWLQIFSPWISHFHIHNNHGSSDTHSALADGSIPMAEFLPEAIRLCPAASFTIETTQAGADLLWLQGQRLLD